MTVGHWPPSDVEELGLTRWYADPRMRERPALIWVVQQSPDISAPARHWGFLCSGFTEEKDAKFEQHVSYHFFCFIWPFQHPVARDRKREADESTPILEAKRPRLEADLAGPEDAGTSAETVDLHVQGKIQGEEDIDNILAKRNDGEMGVTPPEAKGKGMYKASGSEGPFKENPYTFVPSDDPILQSCM